MQIICDYARTEPIVVGHYDDGVPVDMAHDDLKAFVLVPWMGDLASLPKVGPEPELMGDPPTKLRPSADELIAAGIPRYVLGDDGEPLRDAEGDKVVHDLHLVAGKPYPDNRRLAEDCRPYAAPSQGLSDVQRAYLAHVRWAREVGGTVVDGFQAFTTREAIPVYEAAASRASRDPKFGKVLIGRDGKTVTLDAPALIRLADAVADHVQACFDLEAKLLADIASGKIADFKPIDAAFAEFA